MMALMSPAFSFFKPVPSTLCSRLRWPPSFGAFFIEEGLALTHPPISYLLRSESLSARGPFSFSRRFIPLRERSPPFLIKHFKKDSRTFWERCPRPVLALESRNKYR